jgi:hypothetical protein
MRHYHYRYIQYIVMDFLNGPFQHQAESLAVLHQQNQNLVHLYNYQLKEVWSHLKNSLQSL